MSQKDKILGLLQDGNWHCTSSMYAMYMADPRTILAKLYSKGNGNVERHWCKSHQHDGKMKEWRLKPKFDVEQWNEQFKPKKVDNPQNPQLDIFSQTTDNLKVGSNY